MTEPGMESFSSEDGRPDRVAAARRGLLARAARPTTAPTGSTPGARAARAPRGHATGLRARRAQPAPSGARRSPARTTGLRRAGRAPRGRETRVLPIVARLITPADCLELGGRPRRTSAAPRASGRLVGMDRRSPVSPLSPAPADLSELAAESRAFYAARGERRGPASFEELQRARATQPPTAPSGAVTLEHVKQPEGRELLLRIAVPASGPVRGVYLDIPGGGFYLSSAAAGDAATPRWPKRWASPWCVWTTGSHPRTPGRPRPTTARAPRSGCSTGPGRRSAPRGWRSAVAPPAPRWP